MTLAIASAVLRRAGGANQRVDLLLIRQVMNFTMMIVVSTEIFREVLQARKACFDLVMDALSLPSRGDSAGPSSFTRYLISPALIIAAAAVTKLGSATRICFWFIA